MYNPSAWGPAGERAVSVQHRERNFGAMNIVKCESSAAICAQSANFVERLLRSLAKNAEQQHTSKCLTTSCIRSSPSRATASASSPRVINKTSAGRMRSDCVQHLCAPRTNVLSLSISTVSYPQIAAACRVTNALSGGE